MNSTKELSYLLNELFEGSVKAKNQLKHFEIEIKLNGFVNIAAGENKAKIYTPQLAHILTSEYKVPAIAGKRKTQINGLKYWQAYFEGFKQGENYFEIEFKPNASTLYSGQVEKYVTDLHNHYWHSKVLGSFEGWASVKFNYPFVLNQKSIKEFGYYSGIVSKADELIKLHQQVFADFDKCQHSISEKKDKQPNKPQTKTVPSTFEELFFVASNAEICLQILKEIEPAVITDINHYMGSNKGIFPILMKELERTGLIRPQKPIVYRDLLNKRITGLNLSKDASEWRKEYKRLETNKTALSIKALISQYSQSGKLGK